MLKIFKGIESYKSSKNGCVTSGTFDGVHLGHQKILRRLANEAEMEDLESVLVTFEPHPRKVLFPDQQGLSLINTLEEKLERLESSGITSVIVHPFTLEFSRTSALIYVRDLLVDKVNMKKLVIGYDHQFGKNREGSIEQLNELAPLYEFVVEEIPAQEIDDVNVSSTKIRYALSEGNIMEANTFLNYQFYLSGKVVKGAGRGRDLGFPTANIDVANPDKIIPAIGVYQVDCKLEGKTYRGVVNIGSKPTFEENAEQSIEAHLLNFSGDIYGKDIQISFIDRLRGEQKFGSEQELIDQIKRDIIRVSE